MKNLLLLVLFSSLLAAAYSATFVERQSTLPGHENECYDKEDKIFYKPGQEMKWKLGFCGRKICTGARGKGSVYAETQSCGVASVPPECTYEPDLSLPYPECCGTLVCPEPAAGEKNVFTHYSVTL